jgi:RNA polymerase sigma-70 factor (ECF subfamily)
MVPENELLAQMPWVRRLALALTRDGARADDVSQEALLAALERAPAAAREGPPLRAWLASVVRRLASHEARAEKRRAQREQRAARSLPEPSASDVVERAALFRELVEAVLALEEPYRSTLLLHFLDGVRPVDIARQSGVSPECVRQRLARGLARLRERLDRGSPRWPSSRAARRRPRASRSPL